MLDSLGWQRGVHDSDDWKESCTRRDGIELVETLSYICSEMGGRLAIISAPKTGMEQRNQDNVVSPDRERKIQMSAVIA